MVAQGCGNYVSKRVRINIYVQTRPPKLSLKPSDRQALMLEGASSGYLATVAFRWERAARRRRGLRSSDFIHPE
jgi:hypothetical protein